MSLGSVRRRVEMRLDRRRMSGGWDVWWMWRGAGR